MQSELVIAGDFNAKAPDWGEAQSISTGCLVADMNTRLDLVVLTQGITTTFRRPGYRETIIDLWQANAEPRKSRTTRVAITCTLRSVVWCWWQTSPDSKPPPSWWNIDKMNPERLSSVIAHDSEPWRRSWKNYCYLREPRWWLTPPWKSPSRPTQRRCPGKHQVGQGVLPTGGRTRSRTFVRRACSYTAQWVKSGQQSVKPAFLNRFQ